MNIAKLKRIKLILSIVFIIIMFAVFTFLIIDMGDTFLKMTKTGDYTYLEEYFAKFGVFGPLFIVFAQSLQIVLAIIPSEPIQILAGLSYGPIVGFLASLLGLILGNFIIYVLVRKLGSNFLLLFKNKDIKKAEKVRQEVDKIQTKKIGFLVFILYLLPGIPCGLIAFIATSTKMKFHKYMVVTTIGVIPSIVADIFLGEMIKLGNGLIITIIIIVLVILTILSVVFHNKLLKIFAKGDHHEKDGEIQDKSTQA